MSVRNAKHRKRAVEWPRLLARDDCSPKPGRVIGSNAPFFRVLLELGANWPCVATIVWTFGPSHRRGPTANLWEPPKPLRAASRSMAFAASI